MRQRRRDQGGWGRWLRTLLGLIFVAGLLSHRPAHAVEQDAAARQVEKLAAEAIAAYKAADYARTIELLERAYQIRQVAALLYNLAKAYEKLGDQEKSVELYRRYSDSTDADPKLRVKAEARVAAYEEAHRGRRDARLGADAGNELHARVDATPDPGPDPGKVRGTGGSISALAEAQGVRAWKARRARDRIVGLSLGGLGVACALAGVGLSVSAYYLHDTYANTVGLENDRRAERDNARNQALASDVLYGVAVASAGVGAYFLWRGYHREQAPHAGVSVVAPFASPVGAGLVLGGSF